MVTPAPRTPVLREADTGGSRGVVGSQASSKFSKSPCHRCHKVESEGAVHVMLFPPFSPCLHCTSLCAHMHAHNKVYKRIAWVICKCNVILAKEPEDFYPWGPWSHHCRDSRGKRIFFLCKRNLGWVCVWWFHDSSPLSACSQQIVFWEC